MIDASGYWIPRDDKCHRTPFKAGVDRALVEAFPLADDVLPDQIIAALQNLDDAEEAAPADRSVGKTR